MKKCAIASWALVVVFPLISFVIAYEGVPFHSVTNLDKGMTIVVKFVADNQELGADESFPPFICEPAEGDYIHGFTDKWYVVKRRTHDWMGRRGRSQPQFTIFVDRTDAPPKTAEGDCN